MIAGITGLTLFVATFCFLAWLCYKIYPSVFLLFRQWCNLRDLSLLPRHWLLGHLYIVRELIARVLVFCPYAYMAHRRMGRPIRVWVRLVTWWLYTYVSRMQVHAWLCTAYYFVLATNQSLFDVSVTLRWWQNTILRLALATGQGSLSLASHKSV